MAARSVTEDHSSFTLRYGVLADGILCFVVTSAGVFAVLLPIGLLLTGVEWDGLQRHLQAGLGDPQGYWLWTKTIGDGFTRDLAMAWGIATLAALAGGSLRIRRLLE